jgi:hypothetical protein
MSENVKVDDENSQFTNQISKEVKSKVLSHKLVTVLWACGFYLNMQFLSVSPPFADLIVSFPLSS